MTTHFLRALVVLFLLTATAGFALGGVMIEKGPASSVPDETIVFNRNGLTLSGETITGATNQSNYVLDITGSPVGETIQASDGYVKNFPDGSVPYQGLVFTPNADGTFTNPDLQNFEAFGYFKIDVDANGNGKLLVEVDGLDSTFNPIATESKVFDLDKYGHNYFRVKSDDIRITQVSITSLAAGGNMAPVPLIKKLKRIWIGDFYVDGPPDPDPDPGPGPPPGTAVPEPTSVAMWLVIGSALAFFGRNRIMRRAD